jgi:HK97 gp10 family phage protein
VADQFNLDVIGTPELIAALKALPKEIVGKKGGPLKSGMMSAMFPVLRDAQATAPVWKGKPRKDRHGNEVEPGRLKIALKRRRHPNPRKLDEIVGVGVFAGRSREDRKGAYYAHFVHKGTVKQRANPWLLKSMERYERDVVKRFNRSATRATLNAAKKIGRKNDAAVRRLAAL